MQSLAFIFTLTYTYYILCISHTRIYVSHLLTVYPGEGEAGERTIGKETGGKTPNGMFYTRKHIHYTPRLLPKYIHDCMYVHVWWFSAGRGTTRSAVCTGKWKLEFILVVRVIHNHSLVSVSSKA